MSGSGSSIFGLFSSEAQAKECAKEFDRKEFFVAINPPGNVR
jgi:4-diphosphocytidyl-2C-methyl-D-erythritol kinase